LKSGALPTITSTSLVGFFCDCFLYSFSLWLYICRSSLFLQLRCQQSKDVGSASHVWTSMLLAVLDAFHARAEVAISVSLAIVIFFVDIQGARFTTGPVRYGQVFSYNHLTSSYEIRSVPREHLLP
jgi:hypothetical protein